MDKKWKARDKHLRKKYGISAYDYENMLASQAYCCDLCVRHQSQFKQRLSVDHNHQTGVVRGLVCYRCNKFIIGRHDLKSAERLYQYMKRHELPGKVGTAPISKYHQRKAKAKR